MQNNKVKHNVNSIENSIFRVEMQKKKKKKKKKKVYDFIKMLEFLVDNIFLYFWWTKIHKTLQIEQHESNENWDQPMCSARASSSFSTCGSHRVTLVSIPVLIHE
jgi:hypothetical protein